MKRNRKRVSAGNRGEMDRNRQEVRKPTPTKKRKRRRSKNLVLFLFIVLVAVVVVFFLAMMLFKIKSVEVSGETRYANEDIIESAGISGDETIWTVDFTPVEARLLESFPYIGKVTFTREIPSTIVIHVEEAAPAFQFYTGQSYLLTDENYRILEAAENSFENIPVVKSSEITDTHVGGGIDFADENTKNLLMELKKAIDAYALEPIGEIDVTSQVDISLLYDNRLIIKLGSLSDLNYKLEFGQKIIDEQVGADATGTLDLSRLSENGKNAYFRRHALDNSE